MSISREGLNLLKELEGYRPRAVSLANGRWLIGYGHTKYARGNMRVTEPEAEILLRHDLLAVVDELNTRIFAPLSQGQFDALALFAYNIGLQSFRASGVCDLLNVGQPLAAAQEIGRWRVAMVNGAPVVIDALARRRAAELDLFLRTADNVRPATTHLLTPLSEGESTSTEALFDSPLQVFRPAPAPTSTPAQTPAAPSVSPPPETAPAPIGPPADPRPPSTLRTRFHDLIARRRDGGWQDGSTIESESGISQNGIAALGAAVFVFALVAVAGFLTRLSAVLIAGLAATALCASALVRMLERPKEPQDEAPDEDARAD